MSWFNKFLDSSIGQKVVMALSGLFLMIFLIVHLLGNLQLIASDGGQAFNQYAYFMTHNPIIKTTSYLLYATILLHAYKGIRLWLSNRAARGPHKYAVTPKRSGEFSSKNMAWFGIVIAIFIVLHMWQFWFQMHWGDVQPVTYEGDLMPVKNLYATVAAAFSSLPYVIFYVISMAVVGFHLWHGFWSTFQTLGMNHKKYTPLIKAVGYGYSILIPLAYAIIPLYMYFTRG